MPPVRREFRLSPSRPLSVPPSRPSSTGEICGYLVDTLAARPPAGVPKLSRMRCTAARHPSFPVIPSPAVASKPTKPAKPRTGKQPGRPWARNLRLLRAGGGGRARHVSFSMCACLRCPSAAHCFG
ncbi:hypothetical protein CALCODRAFT_34389 [Calocera cornea HHB12733]|uniref:Uncharacterized protein n=1 Tax=Calocera cornea HHB12733 TaxID=1353952 RepID=A0A165E1G9_9BASI|nr:hypothetical protein CALCODRAFT_34389 [Calocera cornea HHB12733]